MAVLASDPKLAHASASPESFRVITRLLSRIWSLPAVQKVALAATGEHIDLWVFLREETPEDEDRIYLYEREYRTAVGVVPFELHVVPLDAVDADVLPALETIFER